MLRREPYRKEEFDLGGRVPSIALGVVGFFDISTFEECCCSLLFELLLDLSFLLPFKSSAETDELLYCRLAADSLEELRLMLRKLRSTGLLGPGCLLAAYIPAKSILCRL